jgi:uncharacterized Zn finger protein
MEIVTRKGEGLFPSPTEISLSCSCPDWATMCKHVAATLYGVGARLDQKPEMLFTLRGVDPAEMVEAAVEQPPRAGMRPRGRLLASKELSSVFGVDIDMGDSSSEGLSQRVEGGRRTVQTEKTRKKTGKRSATARKPRSRAKVRKKKPPAKKAKPLSKIAKKKGARR